jgi:hypothetical protein
VCVGGREGWGGKGRREGGRERKGEKGRESCTPYRDVAVVLGGGTLRLGGREAAAQAVALARQGLSRLRSRVAMSRLRRLQLRRRRRRPPQASGPARKNTSDDGEKGCAHAPR